MTKIILEPFEVCKNTDCEYKLFVCYGLKKDRKEKFICEYDELEKLYAKSSERNQKS
jgi:hypothetical protein